MAPTRKRFHRVPRKHNFLKGLDPLADKHKSRPMAAFVCFEAMLFYLLQQISFGSIVVQDDFVPLFSSQRNFAGLAQLITGFKLVHDR